jgi:hypothetical protein
MRRSLVSWWFVWHRFSLAAWDHAGTLVGWWVGGCFRAIGVGWAK